MKKTKKSWIEIFITFSINHKDDIGHLYIIFAAFAGLLGTLLKVDDKRVDRALIVNKVHAFGIIFYLEEVTADFTHYLLFYYGLVNILFIFGIFFYLLNFLYAKFRNVINFNLLFFIITPFVIPIFYFIIFLMNFFIIIKKIFNNYIVFDIYYDCFIYFLYMFLFILFFIIFYLWIKMFYNYFNNIIISYNSNGMNNSTVHPELDPPNNPKDRIKELLTYVINRLDEYKYHIIGGVIVVGGISYIYKQLMSNAIVDSELLKNFDNNVNFKKFSSFRNSNQYQLFKSGIHKHILINNSSCEDKMKKWDVIEPIMKKEESKVIIHEPVYKKSSTHTYFRIKPALKKFSIKNESADNIYKDATILINEVFLKNEKLHTENKDQYVLRIFHFLKLKFKDQDGLNFDNEKFVLNLCWEEEFIKRYNTMFSDYIYIYKELVLKDFLKFDIMFSKISVKNLKFNTLMQTSKIDDIDVIRKKYLHFKYSNWKNFNDSLNFFEKIQSYLKVIKFEKSLFLGKDYDIYYFKTVNRLLQESTNILSAPIEEKGLWGSILLKDDNLKKLYFKYGINFFIEKNKNNFERSMVETLIENKIDPLLKDCEFLLSYSILSKDNQGLEQNNNNFLKMFHKKKLVYFLSEYKTRYAYRKVYLEFINSMLLSNDFSDSVKLKHLKNLKYFCSIDINVIDTKNNDILSLYDYLKGLSNKKEMSLKKGEIQDLLMHIILWQKIRLDFIKHLDELIQIFEEKNNLLDILNNEIKKSPNAQFEFLNSINVTKYIFASTNQTSYKLINLLFLNRQELMTYTIIDEFLNTKIYISFD
jgi:hypothetical protein